jgi:type IV pilus assembly protein PilY1
MSLSVNLVADDTEIYQIYGGRPKVLIAIDDSGSMSTALDGSTRMAIVQDVITKLITDNTDIDFGVLEFNSNLPNADYDGGRIVSRIVADMSEAERGNMITLVNSIRAGGSTPLCESTYEAYRYLSGQAVVYGDKWQRGDADNDVLPRDVLAEDPNEPVPTYQSPATGCGPVFVVILTDGEPQNDTGANQAVKDLVGKTGSCGIYPTFGQGDAENCLPELVEHMASTDLDSNGANGVQNAITYTIGFTIDQQLLSDAADRGPGKYYTADNAAELSVAFGKAIKDIRATDTGLTSPAVAVDTFTRTESRNEVFFAMFKPDNRVNWPGNIKRLDISLDPDTGLAELVDGNGNAAIDPVTGHIRATATTVWSTDNNDGPIVEKGGVGAVLKARDPATRRLYTNTGPGDVLLPFATGNMTPSAFGFASDAELYDFFGVADRAEFDTVVDWGRGYDSEDEDEDGATDDTRWILADMLHSKPLVINYGARTNAFSAEDPDQRIVVGTNGGFLHMFNNDDGEEDWAFFPKELGPVLNLRRQNTVSGHVYGVDATAVVYTRDLNRDGNLIASDGDKVYLYFGLRRGGRILYAMDISDPGSPVLLWRIDADTAGFAELGQTWSVPVVTRIPGYRDGDGVARPVLVFGAGYDTNKDLQGVATADTMGRGIYIVDAISGELVWSMTPATDSQTNMEEAGLLHSVAAGVTVFDSNGDELSDRIYFADTGGQLWRVDMPGADLPDAGQDSWRAVKMAEVNGGTAGTDRRFFNAPDVVRTAHSGVAFDAILIGSGDRTNPNDMDNPADPNDVAVDNQFYMFRDRAINPYFTDAPSSDDCNADPPSVDFRCQLPLDPNDLYDVSANRIQLGTADEQSAAQAALLAASGWRLDLPNNGEKVLARSITISGRVYISTYTPQSVNENTCEPVSGLGRLYVLNLFNAGAEVDFDGNGNTDRSWIIGEILPDTPSPHFGEDGEIRLLLPPGSGGGGIIDSPFLTGASLPGPYGSYWYREEY